jgi:hypothetical protein
MGDGVVALILLIAFIASAFLLARRRSVLIDPIARGLPAELHGAEIAFAERTFRSHRHQLVARLDRAYRTPMGIQLVELKTRAHDVVYMSDVIELSVQRVALEDETGEAVSSQAWVVVQNSRTGMRRPRKVRLMETEDIVAMRERYADVVQGRVGRPDPARSTSQCSQCAHKVRCAARYHDRA